MKHIKNIISAIALAFRAFYPKNVNALGTSFPVPNTTTFAELQSQASNLAAEQLWAKGLILRTYGDYQNNPFGDNMIGTATPGGKRPMKPVVRVVDTEKVAGTTINIPLVAGFGQPAVYGNGVRVGNEAKIRTNNLALVIGRAWFGMAYDAIARDQTKIGGEFDALIKEGLKQLHAKKRSDDIMMRWIQATGTANGARNLILPDGIASSATLKTANTLTTSLLDKGSQILPGYGANPINLIKDVSGSEMTAFMLLATHTSLRTLQSEPAYLEAVTRGGERGMKNPNFTGQVQDWNGLSIYRWINVDHGNKGPVGSPLMPRALLGVAANAVGNASVLQGGGYSYTAADVPLPNYFEHFAGAFYTFHNGEVIAQNTGSTRYVLITNPSGTYGVFPYTTVGTTSTDANTLTISGAAITVVDANGGTQVTTFVQGATIQQCNVLGVPWAYSCFMGADTVAIGDGSIDGKKVDSAFGLRSEYTTPYGTGFGVGAEAVHGSVAVVRQDGLYPNFLLAQHALPSVSAPTVV